MDKAEEKSVSRFSSFFKKIKKPGKNMFWAWIAYQCIKGTLTTTFIWVPLLYVWFHQ